MDQKENANLHKGHRQRMLDMLLLSRGEYMYEHQMLEMLLYYCYARTDTNGLAHKLLDCYGNIENVLEAGAAGANPAIHMSEQLAEFLKQLNEYKNEIVNERLRLNITDYDRFIGLCVSLVKDAQTPGAIFFADKCAQVCGVLRAETDPMKDWLPDARELRYILRCHPSYFAVVLNTGNTRRKNTNAVFDYYVGLLNKFSISYFDAVLVQNGAVYKVVPSFESETLGFADSHTVPYEECLFKAMLSKLTRSQHSINSQDCCNHTYSL
ncbi:MAG: hypothetical protein IJO93_03945 [Clostridia bacterium]|nr:hypothetical protein [Clostridia bacterium]